MYLLGIDGGGTKIEFLVTDLDSRSVVEFRYEESCNLKYTAASKIIKVLDRGLAAIQASGIALESIQYAYLGIAECGPDGVGQGRDEILEFLGSKLRQFDLQDDQYSVFRAGAPTNDGMLANAGTGSNINNFVGLEVQSYKSIGIGGRDFGKLILGEIVYGGIGVESEIYKLIRDNLGQDPVQFYADLSFQDKIKHKFIPSIPKILLSNLVDNLKLQKELRVYEVFLANRWSTKISAYASMNFGYDFLDTFDLVLSGGMWKWDSMRYMMIEDLKRIYPNVAIVFDPNLKPVKGCIEIAYERSCMDSK